MNATSGTMQMTWSDESRLLELRFDHPSAATRQHGTVLVDLLTRSIGTERRPFGLLCDAAKLSSLDAGYRAVTGQFFRQHREDCVIAAFHMGRLVRIIAEMFRVGTGTRVKGFAGEADARAWLRANGISA